MARILIAEDDERFRGILHETLLRMGHMVVATCNGVEAMEEFQHRPVDVVITDLLMPEKEGLDTIHELMQICPEAKIIAMSSGSRVHGDQLLTFAKFLGAGYTLHKPFTNEQLEAAIQEVTGADQAPRT